MTDGHAKLVSLLSEKKINYWETNDVANNALSVQNKVSIKFHKEKKSVKEGGAARDVVYYYYFLWTVNYSDLLT